MTLALLADLAQILAEAFLEPDADLKEVLEDLLNGGPSPALAEPLARMATHTLVLQEQSVEYTRLFLQARDTDVVHLFESVQARGHQMAPEVLGPLQGIYDEADISVQEDLAVPPDHLGLELACLSHLLAQVIEGDLAERQRFVELARRLLRDHLSPLVKVVAGQLPQVSAHAYYQAAADLASALLPATEKALAEI
ncbi:MAG: molecular chaperone TorD family protein [Geothrix sp.]|uniref:molecular chaperone TorD family protein n=1 Tax=Geothrix sp. TaxID=1962974 RepID=UPI0017B2B6C8|nr:molecular chaperone TorD family protein [Geothrix sp.]NWJ42037.1 molecular chaperone TorD family protein [Geothrix sp.]WIL19995.1 MAG: molecular chaperone TorD family protein [Geothrix sp.]